MIKFVLISDTHNMLNQVEIPDGDVLIHAGDLTGRGTIQETSKELYELSKYRNKFKTVILVEGNHDFLGEKSPHLMDRMCSDNGIVLLRDSFIHVGELKVYGSPWNKEFHNWAFNLPPGEALRVKWRLIPDDTDILITHTPPYGILDYVVRFDGSDHLGCEELYNRIQELKNLKLNVFGHIHYAHGSIKIGDVSYINASICTEQYKTLNKPFVFSC